MFYAYGNIEFQYRNWNHAIRAYTDCLNISRQETPIHPITAAAYYSLGCVEYELHNWQKARAFLDKARAIAELRSPARDDGTVARVLWKIAKVLDEEPLGGVESLAVRTRAEVARSKLVAQGEGTIPIPSDDATEIETEEASYDLLVPGYYR